ncbi:MAG: hypothetical protein ACOC93_02200, partial [Planctomycetota bacterium]
MTQSAKPVHVWHDGYKMNIDIARLTPRQKEAVVDATHSRSPRPITGYVDSRDSVQFWIQPGVSGGNPGQEGIARALAEEVANEAGIQLRPPDGHGKVRT